MQRRKRENTKNLDSNVCHSPAPLVDNAKGATAQLFAQLNLVVINGPLARRLKRLALLLMVMMMLLRRLGLIGHAGRLIGHGLLIGGLIGLGLIGLRGKALRLRRKMLIRLRLKRLRRKGLLLIAGGRKGLKGRPASVVMSVGRRSALLGGETPDDKREKGRKRKKEKKEEKARGAPPAPRGPSKAEKSSCGPHWERRKRPLCPTSVPTTGLPTSRADRGSPTWARPRPAADRGWTAPTTPATRNSCPFQVSRFFLAHPNTSEFNCKCMRSSSD